MLQLILQHKHEHKVHFEKLPRDASYPPSKQWSPYGCHYYPDPKAFPAPKLDTLPGEPLRKGEQYFLDLAGNICKVIFRKEYYKFMCVCVCVCLLIGKEKSIIISLKY